MYDSVIFFRFKSYGLRFTSQNLITTAVIKEKHTKCRSRTAFLNRRFFTKMRTSD
jgi:hypothetical protein